MVCSPEQSRINGSKGRGATTERGRSIAAKNARKHGLRSIAPPILECEDLSSFQGLMQSLITEHQPVGAIEHHLIQQICMGMWKLHRLWQAETAAGNLTMLKANAEAILKRSGGASLRSQEIALNRLREDYFVEQSVLKSLIQSFSQQLETQDSTSYREWIENVLQAIENYPPEGSGDLAEDLSSFEQWLGKCQRVELPAILEVVDRLQFSLDLAEKRLAEISPLLQEIDKNQADQRSAEILAASMPDAELFLRYQREISRSLYEAIDRLREAQAFRNQGSTGSSG